MFNDPQFWVAIAFVIFLILIFNPVRKILKSSLDSKINEISKSIDEAENIKTETQEVLSGIKKRQNEVEIEIQNIYNEAKERILFIEKSSQIKLKDQIDKKKLLAESKIKQLTKDTNIKIQKQISQTAIKSAVTLLIKKLNLEEKQKLIDQSITDLRSVLKN